MKNYKIAMIAMIIISLFTIAAVSATDADAVNVIKKTDVNEVQSIEEVNHDSTKVLSQDGEDKVVTTNVNEDDKISEDAPAVNAGENITQTITIKVDGKELNSFNYTYVNGSFDFKDLLEKFNMSGDADFNMSKFGDFSQMFNMFNDVNFVKLNKTFNFKINGEVGAIKYGLKVISNDVNFLFDYSIYYPNGSNSTPVSDAKRIEIFADKELLANLTIVNGNPDFDFSKMIKMFDMSQFNMSSFANFKDMMGMFQNINFTGNNSISDNKTFDFKISGFVRDIAYDLFVYSNLTDFVFDYNISNPVVETILTAKDLTTTAVNTAIDGKTGGYLTVTLKDMAGIALANKALKLVLDGKTYTIKTGADGVAKHQVNLAKAGTYTATIFYIGDEQSKASMTTAKITVNKQKTTLKPNKNTYTFTAKAKKTVKVTLKNAKGKAIKGKQITLKIKNKTFKAKTNAKGIATITVNFTTKGKYTVTTKFAGDTTYKTSSKNVKIVIK